MKAMATLVCCSFALLSSLTQPAAAQRNRPRPPEFTPPPVIIVTPVPNPPPRPSNGMAGQNAGVFSLSVPLAAPFSSSAPPASTDP